MEVELSRPSVELISVVSGQATAEPGAVIYTISVDMGQGPETHQFVYRPDDPFGLAPGIKEWLATHDVVVAPYVAP